MIDKDQLKITIQEILDKKKEEFLISIPKKYKIFDDVMHQINLVFIVNEEKFSKIYFEVIKKYFFLEDEINLENYEIALILLETKNLISKELLEEIENNIEDEDEVFLTKINKYSDKLKTDEIISLYFLNEFKIEINLKRIYKLIKDSNIKKTENDSYFANFFSYYLPSLFLDKERLIILKKLELIFKEAIFIKPLANFLGKSKLKKNFLNNQNYNYSNFNTLSKSPTNTIGIINGNNLEIILRYQLLYKKRPFFNKIFNLNFIEKKLLELEQKDLEKSKDISNNEGAFIICLDTSGSMKGKPEDISKAIVFEIVKLALIKKRKVFIINFSSSVINIELKSWKEDCIKLYEFLLQSFGQGTDIDIPLEIALEKIEDKNFSNSDVLLISDFWIFPINQKLQDQIYEAKLRKNNFYGLNINNYDVNKNVEKKLGLENFSHIFYYNYNKKEESSNNILKEIESLIS